MFKHQMLPERAEVILAQWVPPAGETDKPGIEGIDFRLLNQLILTAAMEGTDQGDGMGYLQCPQVAFHRGACDANGSGGPGHLKLASALAQQIFEQRVEAIHVPKTKQPLDVAGKKGVKPFPVK